MPKPSLPLPSPCDESTRRNTLEYLKSYSFPHVENPHKMINVTLLIIGLTAVILSFVYHDLLMKYDLEVGEVIVALVTFGAVLLGYQQWSQQRHEISMDKYYDRLDIANRLRSEAGDSIYPLVRHSPPESDLSTDYSKWLYIYAELDNLEYVVEKYRWGFMNVEQACRGLRTFQRRCRSEDFRRMALARVERGDYNATTAEVVRAVTQNLESALAASPEKSTRAA